MNLSFINCYFQKSMFKKRTLIFSEKLIHLFSTLEIMLKDLYNSNDFSLISVSFKSLTQIYNLKNTTFIEKKLFLNRKENCTILEEDIIEKNFFKKLKNFAFWQSKQWIFEKETFSNSYFILNQIFIFLVVTPGNFYIDSFIGYCFIREKIETWIALILIDNLHKLEYFKELSWNLKLIVSINLKKTNKDILFNYSSVLPLKFHLAYWKFFNNILNTTPIVKSNLIICVSLVTQI